MEAPDLDETRLALVTALILAGVTGDETFGDLLDAIDEYVELSVADALGRRRRRHGAE